MKKLILGLFIAMAPAFLWADEVIVSATVTSTGTFACITGGVTIPCDLSPYPRVSVQVTCVSGPCVGEIDLQQRNTATDPFASPVIQFINPGAADQGYSNIGFGQVQFVSPSWTSGTAKITLTRLK